MSENAVKLLKNENIALKRLRDDLLLQVKNEQTKSKTLMKFNGVADEIAVVMAYLRDVKVTNLSVYDLNMFTISNARLEKLHERLQ